jgi:hypothetical protein
MDSDKKKLLSQYGLTKASEYNIFMSCFGKPKLVQKKNIGTKTGPVTNNIKITINPFLILG